MREGAGAAYEFVQSGAMVTAPCPNDQEPSLTVEWLTVPSGIVIGHWLTCAVCRPDGIWSCARCATAVAPDAVLIRSHVAECYG